MIWTLLYPGMTEEHLGYLPDMLDETDLRPAKEQIHENYQHGGGWSSAKGFTLNNDNTLTSPYPEDPITRPVAFTKLREELIILYQHDWVAIIQPDRSYEVSRID